MAHSGAFTTYLKGVAKAMASFASSYIPTVASQVTRAADQVSILTSAFGYNAAEGTISAGADVNTIAAGDKDVVSVGDDGRFIEVSGATIRIFDGANIVNASIPAVALTPFKAASSYGAGALAITVNGAAPSTGAFDGGMTPAAASMLVGRRSGNTYLNGHIKRLTYFPVRKTNAELVVLST